MRPDSANGGFRNANNLKHAKGLAQYGWKQIKSSEEYCCQSAGVLFRSAAEILIRLRIAEAGFNERDVVMWKAMEDKNIVDPSKDANLTSRLGFAEKNHLISNEEYNRFCNIRNIGNIAAHEVITRNTDRAKRVRDAGCDLNRLISKTEELGTSGNWHDPLERKNFYSDCLKKCLESQKQYKKHISRHNKDLANTINVSERAKAQKALEDDEEKSDKLKEWTNDYYDVLSSIDPGKALSTVREHSRFREQGAFGGNAYDSNAHRQFISDREHAATPKPSGYRYRGTGALLFIAFVLLGLCFMVMICIGNQA